MEIVVSLSAWWWSLIKLCKPLPQRLGSLCWSRFDMLGIWDCKKLKSREWSCFQVCHLLRRSLLDELWVSDQRNMSVNIEFIDYGDTCVCSVPFLDLAASISEMTFHANVGAGTAWPTHMIKPGDFSNWLSVVATNLRWKLASVSSAVFFNRWRSCSAFFGEQSGKCLTNHLVVLGPVIMSISHQSAITSSAFFWWDWKMSSGQLARFVEYLASPFFRFLYFWAIDLQWCTRVDFTRFINVTIFLKQKAFCTPFFMYMCEQVMFVESRQRSDVDYLNHFHVMRQNARILIFE